jgi:hypothetical protein
MLPHCPLMPRNRRHTVWAACREFCDASEDHFSDFSCLFSSAVCYSAAAVSCHSRICLLGAPRARLHTGASRTGNLPALLQLALHSLHSTRCSSRTARHLLHDTRCPHLLPTTHLHAIPVGTPHTARHPLHVTRSRCPPPTRTLPAARLPLAAHHSLLFTCCTLTAARTRCSPFTRSLCPLPSCLFSISAETPSATDCSSLRCHGSVATGREWQSW